ncbi:MAG: ABC transporter ATP-binding protein/permease [Firmicutes bacterium]|nr:ABC transporter ATP-binding protein/permease [Bacillota bacterium]
MARKIFYVPSYMEPAFLKAGVDASVLVYAAHTDMEPDGSFSDAYCAVSRDALYILYGKEGVVRMEGARRIVASYEPKRLETYPLAGLGALECEKLLTTGRLWATHKKYEDSAGGKNADKVNHGENADKISSGKDAGAGNPDPELLLCFSIGCLPYVERLIKAAKNLAADSDDPLREILTDEELFCPKCGSRYPEPDRKLCPKCMDRMSLSRRLLGFFRNYRKRMALIMSVIILSTAASIFVPLVSSRMLFDDVLTEGGRYYGLVGRAVLLIFGVRLLGAALNMLYTYVLARVVPWIIYDLKMKIFEAMQRLSVGFYTSKRTGQVMNRVVRDANNIYWFFVDGLPFVIVNILLFAGVVAVMFALNVRLAAICLAIVPIAVTMFRALQGFFRRHNHKSWVYGSQLNSMVSDSVNGQRVIKAFAREDEESGRFAALGGKEAKINNRMINMGYTAFPLIYTFMFLGQVAVTAIGGMMVLRHQLTIGTLLTFIAYLGMLYGPLEFMSWVSNWWARCMDSAQRVFEIIDAKPDVAEPADPAPITDISGGIAVKSVWFEYEAATPILKGLDLRVEAGRLLGVVGKTGAGKSTLANLIARLYDVKEGAVEIDGVDVRRIPLKLLRRSIGIVSQEIYLFIGSIADNIRYARPDASLEDVIRAAKAASAHEFIMNLPDGYETRVGAGGQDLSGGERQRLSIARTIIQNPKILILDEATAAMDTETEAAIQASLTKLQRGRTTIAIAHRLSTLRDADSLAVIDNGKIVESGTHAELMEKKGEYHKLYTIQMEGLKIINMDAAV